MIEEEPQTEHQAREGKNHNHTSMQEASDHEDYDIREHHQPNQYSQKYQENETWTFMRKIMRRVRRCKLNRNAIIRLGCHVERGISHPIIESTNKQQWNNTIIREWNLCKRKDMFVKFHMARNNYTMILKIINTIALNSRGIPKEDTTERTRVELIMRRMRIN